MGEEKVIPVRVALRSRPLVTKEIVEGCQANIKFVPGEPQVVVGRDKAFTFDYTFSFDSKQCDIYNKAVADRINYIFKGYNVTVLAYGQTGSGKTYTMGTAYSSSATDDESQLGIIQRAVCDIFNGIQQRSTSSEFLVKVSFLEVYKEDVYDLLHKTKDNAPISLSIREDCDGIKVVGLTELPVQTTVETLRALEQGSLCRTTASTAMNARSSRSHAIFTVIVEQRSLTDPTDFIRSKFHLVDLAGSERVRKTCALGERFKEGVKINKGLLALGNVISALGEDASHIPYRDSRLTRLLQDSLGGNSHTVMIACVSPADSNLEETVNTLRYADRARKIKNKPIINRDPHNAELVKLRQEVQMLRIQLIQNPVMNGSRDSSPDRKENHSEDVKVLLERNKDLETENGRLEKELQRSLDQITTLCEKALKVELTKEKLVHELEEFYNEMNETVETLSEEAADQPLLQEQLKRTKQLQDKITILLCERIQRNHEFSVYSPTKAEQGDEVSKFAMDAEEQCLDADATVEERDFHKNSTLKQAAMSRELQELDRALALKEEIALKMRHNDTQISAMRVQFETNLKQMEDEIALLQKEKEDLANALKVAHTTTNSNKVSEQRRKRLQECEAQISQLKKQILEKSKIMKIKEDATRKVAALQQEIQSMKTTRVKLLKQMREEAERYRALKMEKEREVAQLKQKDRKRQCEMTKLKQDFAKQKNVLKRKMEEATAANKRLNDALTQQKSVAERRMREKQNSLQGIGSRVQQWLIQEMEVILSSKEASFYLKNLLDDRKTISEQLTILRKSTEISEKSSEEECEERLETNSQIKALEQELEMRNVQIADLQQKILDADQDEKSNSRWDTIQGMVEAKCALKWLFEKAISSKMEVFDQKFTFDNKFEDCQIQLKTYKAQLQRLNDINEHLKQQIQSEKQAHEAQVAKLIHENEDKTLYFLKQLNTTTRNISSSDSKGELMEKIQFQESEITRLCYLNEELQKISTENESLRDELMKAKKGKKSNVLGDFSEIGVMVPLKKKTKTSSQTSAMQEFLEDSFSSIVSDVSENDENDPEWRMTPLHKRHKRTFVEKENNEASDESSGSEGTKRKRPPVSCTCQGDCKSKKCGCRKRLKICCDSCKCTEERCQNRSENDKGNSKVEGDSLNTTYDVDSTTDSRSHTILMEINGNESSTALTNNSSMDDFSISKTRQTRTFQTSKLDPDIDRMLNEGGLKKKARTNRYGTLGPLQI